MKKKILSFRLLPQTVATIAAVLAAMSLYLYKLGNFIGHSPTEAQTAAANASLRAIAGNPLNLPYKLADFIALQLPFGSLELKSRLASAALALLCGAVFFLLVRRWHGARNASLATALFIPAGWLLHTGRFGAGLILLTLMVLGLAAMSAWISGSEPEKKGLVLSAYGLTVALALLVPAGIWFTIAATLIVWPRLQEHFRESGTTARMIAAVLPALSLALVAVTLLRHPELYRQWLGLPAVLPDMITIGKQAIFSLSFLVVRGPFMPEAWLAHTPLLDVGSAALYMTGLLFYLKHRHNARVRLLAVFLLLGVGLVALHGAPALAYIVPVVYLVIATGLTYLLHQWLSVFPRNPLARSLALVLVGGIVLTIVGYHTQRYFAAWRHSPDTTAAYRADDSDLRHSNLIQ
jgi:hypothetical protein